MRTAAGLGDEGGPPDGPSSTWSRSSLRTAYIGLYLLCYVTSLEMQVTLNLTVFAASAFKAHSLVSTVYVVQAVSFSILKPLAAKIADVFGRFEAFTLCVTVFILGYLGQASSSGINTFAASGILYSAGASGLQVLQQIFIADTSSLKNRALLSTIPDVPFLANVWIGPPVAALILQGPGWRWGYGVWAVILPIVYMPLALSLFTQRRKLRQAHAPDKSISSGKSIFQELDAGGLLLLSIAISFILIPLTLAKDSADIWHSKGTIVMLSLGIICLVAFPLWERTPRLAPSPFFPPHLLQNRTVMACFGVPFFFSAAYYLCVFPYFQSYLLVVRGESITSAGHIVQIFVFVSTITAISVSFLIKHTRRYKVFVFVGSFIYCLGIVLAARYRTADAHRGVIIGCQTIIGIGGGLLIVPAQIGVQASISHSNIASALAVFLTALEVGGAVGSAISGAIWTRNILPKLREYLPTETRDQASIIFGNLSLAATGWESGSPTKDAIDQAYQETMTKMLIVAVFACMPLVPISLMMKNLRLDETDETHEYTNIGGQELEDIDIDE